MQNLPLAAVKRLASVKGKEFRVGEDAVVLINAAASQFIRDIAEESYVFTIHAERRTLKAEDVRPVLEKRGLKIQNIDPIPVKAKPAKKPESKSDTAPKPK